MLAVTSLQAYGEKKTDRVLQRYHPLSPVFSIQPYKLNGISIPALAPTSSLSLLFALVYAKVNPKDQSINKAFPHSDTLKGVQLGWSGDVYQSVRLNTSLWYTKRVLQR